MIVTNFIYSLSLLHLHLESFHTFYSFSALPPLIGRRICVYSRNRDSAQSYARRERISQVRKRIRSCWRVIFLFFQKLKIKKENRVILEMLERGWDLGKEKHHDHP
jgi:hypothetical protein